MIIYDNTTLKLSLKNEIAKKVKHGFDKGFSSPELHIFQVGDEFASNKYIQKKKEMGKNLGIEVFHHHFDTNQSPINVQSKIDFVVQTGGGIIVQLPVPPQFLPIVSNLSWQNDVDLLGQDANMCWQNGLLPPTILAIDLILKDVYKLHNNQEINLKNLDLSKKTVAVIGQGVLVGNPLLRYLRDREATIISINKDTINPKKLTQLADIVITGAGVPGLLDGSWLKDDAILIDAATSESNNKLVGDVDYTKLKETGIVCKSPGGVGPLTVLCLFLNLLLLNSDYKE